MNKNISVPIIVAIISGLALISVPIVTHALDSRKQPTTPTVLIPPTALEEELSKANVSLTEIPGKESLVRQWLRDDPQYQTMAQTILTVLAGKRVINPIPLDVIISKYRVLLGGTPETNYPSEMYKDIEKTKTAMFATWQERHPTYPQTSFDEIVE